MILVFDVETSGLPHWSREMDDPIQPRLAQLGAVMFDLQWNEVATMRYLIQPEGWVMPDNVVDIHGITHEQAQRYGIPIKCALIPFIQLAKRSSVVCAYNMGFDSWFIRAEIKRLGSDDKGIDRPGLRHIDPMKSATTILPYGQRKLSDLHLELLKWDYPQAHDGLHDARACMRCLRVLVEDKKMIEL